MQFGQYELGDLIARGGMAEVYAARRHGAEGFVRAVAIKRIREHISADPEFVRLFIAEARLVARLHHANIVQIHDFDQVEGAYYLAMELVEGRDLRQVLLRTAHQGRRMSPELGLHVACEVAKGLMAAHECCDDNGRPMGIVHRDLSPHNVLLSFSGEVKVTDFGIAKAMNAAAAREPGIGVGALLAEAAAAGLGAGTGSGVVRGKLSYMSPEQVRGEEVDQRTDLFALGLILYELTTGHRRYGSSAGEGLVLEVATAELPNPAEHNAAISPELNGMIRRLLARRPADRFDSAREVLQALREGGGVRDRSLELGAFMQALYPDEAEAARRGLMAKPSAKQSEPTVEAMAAREQGGDRVEGASAKATSAKGTSAKGTAVAEPSGPTNLAAAATRVREGSGPWRHWLIAGGVASMAALVLAMWGLGWIHPETIVGAGSGTHGDPASISPEGRGSRPLGVRGSERQGSEGIPGMQGIQGMNDSAAMNDEESGSAAALSDRAASAVLSEGAAALSIESEPAGAEVLVNGLPTGRRAPARLGVVPGRHRITVRWDDDVEVSEDRELRPGETLSLHLSRPALRQRPPGVPPARVAGGGRPVPVAGGGRPDVVASGREPARTVGEAPARLAPVSLPGPGLVGARRPSLVRFTCLPWAWVSIGGADVGQTPLGRTLAPGRYSVTFRNPNLDQRKTIELRVHGDGVPERLDCRF